MTMTIKSSETTPQAATSEQQSRPLGRKQSPRAGTRPEPKKARLIRLLNSKSGASAAALGEKLGWQAHTVRAALSGLRKAGFEIAVVTKGAGTPTRYRIITGPAATASVTDGAGQ
jgi:biotin operon repressor